MKTGTIGPSPGTFATITEQGDLGLGIMPIMEDLNGDGVVDEKDYEIARQRAEAKRKESGK